MADNVTLNAGTGGATLSTDELAGSVQVQRVKIQYGVDGSATDVSDTNPLPIDDAGGSLTVDNAGLTELAAAINSSRVDVNLAASAATVTVDGSGVTQPVSGTVTANLSATDNAVLDSIDTNTTTLAGAVSGSEMQVDLVGSLPAGTNNIGDVDVATIAAGSNAIGDVGVTVRTSGGTTLYKNIDVDESEDQIKASAGQVYWLHAVNLSGSPLFLKFYNATAASVTVGTTVPDLTFPIPTQGDTNGAGFTISMANGIAFSTAITVACTTGVADNDSGAPGANACVINLGYA